MSDTADVFQEVLALLTPQRLLGDPRATGEGVRVCVVDSGIERDLLEERYRRRGQAIHPIEGAIFPSAQADPLPGIRPSRRGTDH